MKRMYLVLGPEGCGTTLLTRCLQAAGCRAWNTGDARHDWPLAEATQEELVVTKRSLLHGGGAERGWPDLDDLLAEIQEAEFDVNVLAISRMQYCAVRSMVRRHFSTDIINAGHTFHEAMRRISSFVRRNHLWAVYLTYEGIVHDWPVFKAVLQEIGLTLDAPPEALCDGNDKYA